jgi:hypothetical protein
MSACFLSSCLVPARRTQLLQQQQVDSKLKMVAATAAAAGRSVEKNVD